MEADGFSGVPHAGAVESMSPATRIEMMRLGLNEIRFKTSSFMKCWLWLGALIAECSLRDSTRPHEFLLCLRSNPEEAPDSVFESLPLVEARV